MLEKLMLWLDAIAQAWLEWRTDYEVRHNEELQAVLGDLGIRKMEVSEGRMDTTMMSPVVATLAEECAAWLDAHDAENYVQVDMLPRLDRGLRPIRLTVQWAYGESPAQQNARLRKELAEIKESDA